MKNSLGNEASLYLRQHSKNPVAWYSWGEEAFKAAQNLNKPILISIGYSSCHWCHVMAEECFEDDFIADIMNEKFICIKVDREERPDVDQVYMDAVQMIIHRGGWPLNVFCLPDGRPFFGGTYFPPEDKGNGLIPWPQLLIRISNHYKKSYEELNENAEAIRNNLLAQSASISDQSLFHSSNLILALEGICGNHDDRYGGFGEAPKFPQALVLNFLISMRKNSNISEEMAHKIDLILDVTLKGMAHGGIYDQIGGGFSRYSVDPYWLVPHFEKMLYDNALLITSYSRSWLLIKNPLFQDIVKETIEWLDREMRLSSGLYSASLNADTEGSEGRYYVWSCEDLREVLGAESAREFALAYGVKGKGNFEKDMSVLALQDSDLDIRKHFLSARKKLLCYRQKNRINPSRDNKALTAWNCLLASALVEAGFYFEHKEWVIKAKGILDAIEKNMLNEKHLEYDLQSIYYEDSDKKVAGFLHDYAYYAQALLDLAGKIDWVEFGSSKKYITLAEKCMNKIYEKFSDKEAPGFFYTANDESAPIVRRKEWVDNALPSGNAMVLHALSGLYAVTGKDEYRRIFEKEAAVYDEGSKNQASSIASALEAISSHNYIGVIKVPNCNSIDLIRDSLVKNHWRRSFILGHSKSHFELCIGQSCYQDESSVESLFKNYS